MEISEYLGVNVNDATCGEYGRRREGALLVNEGSRRVRYYYRSSGQRQRHLLMASDLSNRSNEVARGRRQGGNNYSSRVENDVKGARQTLRCERRRKVGARNGTRERGRSSGRQR